MNISLDNKLDHKCIKYSEKCLNYWKKMNKN